MLYNNMSHIDAAQETIFNKLTSQFPKQKVPSSLWEKAISNYLFVALSVK